MTSFSDPAFYGDRWAETYDELHLDQDPTAAADFLAKVAGGGRSLELGIGTGRVALPLLERGVPVEGLDASRAIVEQLRAKPRGDEIPVHFGDMAEVPVEGPFQMVYVVFNSIYCLLSQPLQASCFTNVARVLSPGGVFVLDCFVPDPGRFDRGQRTHVLEVTEDFAAVELSLHNPLEQRITTQILLMQGDKMSLGPLALRYVWPSEMDLMATNAGLRLRERYGDWDESPFTAQSSKHISIYERPA